MASPEQQPMPEKDYKATLTDRERDILRGGADVSEKYYYRVVARVRQKIEQLEEDLQVLDDSHDSLGDELREIVCEDMHRSFQELQESENGE